ncbi:Hypothetical predicted protein [Paramuricea clavata]|uniref:P2X purinoreceptor 7 intracellular domain-containing protein n=1 Tax=Paramuricea clavata TaxID=317549 RepID=A0A6S7KRV6_PARCT|nr:Hypothetical predicted protein [Paramuricea clavata]
MAQTKRKSGRGRSRGRGRGGLVPEESAEARQAAQENQLQDLVLNLPHDVLQQLALELLRRHPDVYMDLVNGEIPNQPPQADPGRLTNQPPPADQQPLNQYPVQPLPDQPPPVDQQSPNQPPPDQPPPDQPSLDQPPPDHPNEDLAWCYCGACRSMPTQTENKCCCKRRMQCMTTMPLFQHIVLDANVLEIQMRYREDILAMAHHRNNENFRHAAYRQFVLWHHGKLGKGDRRVVPSCCVLAIRARYPSANGFYVGFRPARL